MPIPTQTSSIDRTTARLHVFRRIRAWIEDGTLVPGDLLRDGELAAKLGVSRTPVREALQMLEQLGAVETLPGRHTRVTDVRESDSHLVYPPLAALHAVAVEAAVGRLSKQDLAEMRSANRAFKAAADRGDADAARGADSRFHAVILRSADNRFLSAAVASLELHARRLEYLFFSLHGPSVSSYHQHNRIIDALAAGDAQAAVELVRANWLQFA